MPTLLSLRNVKVPVTDLAASHGYDLHDCATYFDSDQRPATTFAAGAGSSRAHHR